MVAPRSGSEGVIDHTHDPAAGCWVPGASEHADFPLQNLPLGVFSMGSDNARIAVAIGDWIVNLSAIAVQFPEALVDRSHIQILGRASFVSSVRCADAAAIPDR
jgi:hypothetical protein